MALSRTRVSAFLCFWFWASLLPLILLQTKHAAAEVLEYSPNETVIVIYFPLSSASKRYSDYHSAIHRSATWLRAARICGQGTSKKSLSQH